MVGWIFRLQKLNAPGALVKGSSFLTFRNVFLSSEKLRNRFRNGSRRSIRPRGDWSRFVTRFPLRGDSQRGPRGDRYAANSGVRVAIVGLLLAGCHRPYFMTELDYTYYNRISGDYATRERFDDIEAVAAA